ncbi:arylsulfatase [Polaribacter sp. BAL334]|uniref:arylsulfatase n=1 Tax=Polaribacter sp. BAL334 TaxID=1708178 RepID=UPI0018D2104B|nr:arylsulfatase [Polaribacter sp. BAL334]MBG7612145.1 arylsulfatase [Polaribacter sp. BAL334]
MKRTRKTISAIVLISILVLTSCKPHNNIEGKKPNIILIMADDMGFSDASFFGSGIQTPAIDRLAENGLVFNSFYNTGRCCPTRASLLTGLYAHNTGLGWMTAADDGFPGYNGAINDSCVTIAEVLKEASYTNYMTGKWHVVYDKNMKSEGSKHNWPLQRGFDKYYGKLDGGGGYYNSPTLTYNNKRIKADEDFYLTRAINDSTVSFIRQHLDSKKNQPFFFYVAHYAPHRPLHALEEDIKKYEGKFNKGWDVNRKQRYNRMKEIGMATKAWALGERPNDIPAWDSLDVKEKKIWERRMEVYAAQIDHMDQGIGNIMKTLEEYNELDNTIIIFLSDNGGGAASTGTDVFEGNLKDHIGGPGSNQSYRKNWAHVSNTPFREYKKYTHEGGISTPLIVHWPNKIKEHKIVTQQGHVIDLMATFIDLTKAEYPQDRKGIPIKPIQGKSLLPAFNGELIHREEALYFEHEGNRAIIDGNWKLVSQGNIDEPYAGDWELYDLSVDRGEQNNLITTHPKIVKELMLKWNKWANENQVFPLNATVWRERIAADVNNK